MRIHRRRKTHSLSKNFLEKTADHEFLCQFLFLVGQLQFCTLPLPKLDMCFRARFCFIKQISLPTKYAFYLLRRSSALAQVMHNRAYGKASRRAWGISFPQPRQIPYLFKRIRSSAPSICFKS